VLLRRVIGDALRARRQAQQRTLREVSTAANVSLGYLSEIERGQKEASSELLAAICDALGAALSDVLRDVSDTLAGAAPAGRGPDEAGSPAAAPAGPVTVSPAGAVREDREPAKTPAAKAATQQLPKLRLPRTKLSITDGKVSVAVRHDGPLKTTLRATRTDRGREVVSVG
jgi:transcriptional regulator with XRE-family HTH domain